MHNEIDDKFTGNLLMGFSIALLALFFIGLIWRSKVKKTSMEEYFAHFIMGNFLMLIILCNIFSFVTEAAIATLVHPADEQPISIIARFLQHNVISVVGFLCACVTPFFLMMTAQGFQFFSALKNDKGDVLRKPKPAAFFLLAIMSAVLCFATFYIAWGNCALIAKGFKQVGPFNYAVERFFFFWQSPQEIASRYHGQFDHNREISDYLGFNMNNSFLLFKVHMITSVLEGLMIAILTVVMGEQTIIDKMNQKLIDKDRADRKAKKDDEKTNPKPDAAKADPAKVADTRLPEEKKAEETTMIRKLLSVAAGLTTTQVDEYEPVIKKKMAELGTTKNIPIMEHFNQFNSMLATAEKEENAASRKSSIEKVGKLFRTVCSDPEQLGIKLPD